MDIPFRKLFILTSVPDDSGVLFKVFPSSKFKDKGKVAYTPAYVYGIQLAQAFAASYNFNRVCTGGVKINLRIEQFKVFDVSDAPMLVNWYWLSIDIKKKLFG